MNIRMNEIVKRQQEEWRQKRQQTYVPRIQLSLAKKFLKNSLVKVITGPRRAGKSVLAAILLKDKNAAYFNFDEPLFTSADFDSEQIMPAIEAVFGTDYDYIFLDEIQNLSHWQPFVNRLHREGHNVIISGSNSRLLSGELATYLTGRHTDIEVLPFCFSEYVLATASSFDLASTSAAADSFLRQGGYPEVVLSSGLNTSDYLRTLFGDIIRRDIMARHSLRKPRDLEGVADWLMSNVSKEMSFAGLVSSDSVSLHGLPSSPVTIERYVTYMQDAFLTRLVGRFDRKHRPRIMSPKKVYAIDNGMALATGFRQTLDNGRLLENLVHAELRKAGGFADLRYYRSTQGDKEVDFVLHSEGATTELIQVCWDISDDKTRKRELAGLAAAVKETRCSQATIVTWSQEDDFEIPRATVRAVPFHVWATERSSF